jgi:hypothetical protein
VPEPGSELRNVALADAGTLIRQLPDNSIVLSAHSQCAARLLLAVREVHRPPEDISLCK